jgi:ABC-type branched-subunit amino acid transport system permease subunit
MAQWALPVSLIPVVGGWLHALFAVSVGWVTTKKAATPFAMITMGVGELVWAMSLMFPEFFGGEGGISGNRVTGSKAVRHHLRAADPAVLPDCGVHLCVHGAHVCLHPHAAGPHA